MNNSFRDRARQRHASLVKQAGFTLMETMISLALSLVVTSAMVVLMANSMGTATRIIQMTQLTDQLRNTMSMLTRDIRRANYSANAAYCYANSDCGLGTDKDKADDNHDQALQWGDIDVTDPSCVVFGLDRDFNGNAADNDAGGFRRWPVVIDGQARGVILMWVGDNSVDCDDVPDLTDPNERWKMVTDPDFVDITEFIVDDDASFDGCVIGEAGSTITQFTRQIQVQLEGTLVRDDPFPITRQIDDVIKVRNDMIEKDLPCPPI